MKKSLSITALLLVALTAIFVISCKKDKQEFSDNNRVQKESATIDNMDEYLKSFKKKLQDASFSKETISIEQAQQDFGNLLNFDFGDANYPTNVFQKDTIQLTLPLVDGKICMKDLAEVYQEARKEIMDTYAKVDLPEKSVYAILCSIDQPSRDGNDTEIQLVIITRSVDPGAQFKNSIDTTDNWHVGGLMGKCDGTCVGDDHTTIIKKVFMNNHPTVDCANGRLYYTDYNYDEFYSRDYIETGPVSWNWGYMFWDGNYYEYLTHCVEYPEMQYYYDNFCQVMEDRLPEDHVFITVDCFIDHTVSIEDAVFSYFCTFTTAKPNCTNEPLD